MHQNDQILDLEKKILEANKEYYNTGTPLVSDEVYDAWVEVLKKIDPENLVLKQIGAEPVSEWVKETLPIPMGSLNKAQDPEQFMEWANKYNEGPYIIMDKLDGLSICVEYKYGKMTKAITRGAGLEGENIRQNVMKMQGSPYVLPIAFTGYLRGEIVLTKDNHKKYFADYSNTRNAASGISRRYDGEGSQHLQVIFYQITTDDVEFKTNKGVLDYLKETLHLNIPRYTVVETKEDVIKIWQEYQDKTRAELPYEIDGLVVAINDLEYQTSLGDTNGRPHGSHAFKFIPELKQTTVKDIVWDQGNSARLTPVAILEPVQLAGTIVKRANLHNYSYVKNLGVSIGATVIVAKRNEIIPQVESVILKGEKEADYPKVCPACGEATEFSGEYLVCANVTTCPAHMSGRIRNWTNTLNLLDWGTVLADNVVESKLVATVADLYKLSIEDLSKLPRMGIKSATRAYTILHNNKNVKLEQFLGGLSIKMIGTTLITTIMTKGIDTLEKFMNATQSDFEKISGMGEIKAKSLYNGLQANRKVIEELLKNGVTIKEKVMGKLTDKVFVFTGTMEHPRGELAALVVENGGTVKNSVTKSTTYLVLADHTTTKAAAAKKLGVKCITEEEFLTLCE